MKIDFIKTPNVSTPYTPGHVYFESSTGFIKVATGTDTCEVYGGTAVTLNGTSMAASTASFYAPTTAGTSGYYLKSNGSGAPAWTAFPTIPSVTLNGSVSTSPSFYAPTSAGTSGQFLKSSGSGAPFWESVTIPAAANNGKFSVKTKVGSNAAVTAADFTANQSAADDITFIQGTNVTLTTDTTNRTVTIASADTDRYVNSAAFADDTTNNTANPVKMTLTRAGSDTGTVTCNLPKVSSSSAGVAPKGAAVSTQSQSTKFLREDGSWAAPSYTTNTNTTYKFTIGTTTKGDATNGIDLGTLKSESAAASGTTLSLVTTGEKATWNSKQSNVAKLGSTTKPVYTSAAGTFAECSTYAGGTAVTLNGTSKDASTASFYAPTDAGTSGQFLKSAGTGAPIWQSVTIPAAANNGTYSIKTKVGSNSAVTVSDFTANQSSADDVTFIQGSNVTLTTDATNRTVTIAATDTTYSNATQSAHGLMSAADKTKLDGIASGATANAGTITGITMNNTTKGTSGNVDLGTVITAHATHKLNATNGTASAVSQGTEITYVESIAGTTTATSGDLSVSTTRKKITIPANTDRYVNTAAFADDTTATAASPVKMTLTRAGSDTTAVTANIPKVSSSSAGVAPKGAAVSTQSQSTKFLREDGSWAAPSYTTNTNTTYKFTIGSTTNGDSTNGVSLGTLKSESAASNGTTLSLVTTGEKATWNGKQNALTNPVTRSGSTALTADKVVLGAGTTQVKPSTYGITITVPSSSSDDTTIPTSKAVWTAVADGIAANDAMVYKGTIDGSTGSYGALTAAANRGWCYRVTTAGKIDGVEVEIGDLLICNTDSTAAATSSNYATIAANWDFIQKNIDGAVIGPSSSTSENLASYNGTTGKVIKDSGLTTTNVSDAVSKKHSHSTLTLSTTAQAYDGTHTLALPSSDPYTSARTPSSHSHGNIQNGGTLNDTAAAAAGNDYVVIRDADNNKIQTSTIKGTDVADAITKKHSHSSLTLSTTAQAYDGTHTLALPSSDPYSSARTPSSHTHGNITNAGGLQTNDITIASGDKLVVTDNSDSSKIARTSVSFDGSTTTTALTPKGTFESFSKFSGSYNDLTNKPTIPAAANNGTFSVKTKVGSNNAVTAADFTANQSSADDVTFIQGSNVTLTTDTTNRTVTIAATDTTYSSKSAASGGSDVSLVTTGEKYTWNNKQDSITFNTAYNASTNKAATMSDITKSQVGLSNVTNNKQIPGLSSGTTENHVVTWGTDGYTVKDSGFTIAKSVPSNAVFTDTTYVFNTAYNASTNKAATMSDIPSSLPANGGNSTTVNGHTVASDVPANAVFTDTTYSSQAAANGGSTVSLCTTGEKYTWNNKQASVAKLGSTTKPVYTSAAGTFAECSTYAGGTAVTLNGSSKAGSTASFYAPTTAGTSGQILSSNGSGAPTWIDNGGGILTQNNFNNYVYSWTTATTVASSSITSAICVVTIANGQTAQSFSLASAPTNTGSLHYIINNSGNSSNLTITIPHGTSGGITYVNINDSASGTMTVTKNTYAEINVLYNGATVYVRYINS